MRCKLTIIKRICGVQGDGNQGRILELKFGGVKSDLPELNGGKYQDFVVYTIFNKMVHLLGGHSSLNPHISLAIPRKLQ